MVKTSSDVFCLRREQVWMYSVLGDYIYAAGNAVFEMFILCICKGTCFEQENVHQAQGIALVQTLL